MKRFLIVFTVFHFLFLTGCSLFAPIEEFDINKLPPTAAGSEITVTSQVASSEDDAEQTANGNISISSSDLELTTYGSYQQTVAMRFSLDIPQGARITDATIQFTTDEVTTGAASLLIAAEASDNAAAFVMDSNNISDRPLTSASVSWSPPDWRTVGEASDAQRTPSLATITQEVIGRTGWTQGNYIAYAISGTGTRTAESFNGSASAAPRLTVSYTLDEPETPPDQPTQPTGDLLSITTQVSTPTDDAEESSNGNVTLGSSDLELTYDGSNQQTVGMRFKLDLPQGAQIEDSKIQFTTDEVSNGATALSIYAEASDNSTTFASSTNNISNRAKTTAMVSWNPNDWNAINEATADQQTPPLNAVTQEVVGRPGWTTGNYITYIITGTGRRTAESFDGSQTDAPKLTVFYSLPTVPNEVFVYNGNAYTAAEKQIYDLGYRDGFMSVDNDKDGLPDSWELAYGLDPTNPNDAIDQRLDPDNDVLTAQEEFLSGTNPNDIDSDGDGLPDGYELAYGLSPIFSGDALLDNDGDGYSNLVEYNEGTDPGESTDKPINVPESNTYSAALSWATPTTREDGSPLSSTDISGFTIEYGPSAALSDATINLENPTQKSLTVHDLTAGTYYFTITTVEKDGRKSKPSQQIEVTLLE